MRKLASIQKITEDENILSVDVIQRFWKHVEIKNKDECWNWTASLMGKGYGQIRINNKNYGSNRIAWMIVNGKISDGLFVCHSCDNKLCCNPDHLFLGNNQDNVNDMVSKNRNSKRENHGMSKLNSEDVQQIRTLCLSKKITQLEASKIYNISYQHVSRIVRNERWVE